MFRRKRKDETAPPDQGAGVFQDLRHRVLTLDPSLVGRAPDENLPHVFGVVMDTTYASGTATVVALADGTTSLYTSTGGGVIGGGGHASVVQANHALLVEAEVGLGEFEPTSQPPALPLAGHVTITLLTYNGLLCVTAPEDDLGHRRHAASAVFHAVQGVITALRLTSADSAEPPTPPGGATPLMAAVHRGDLATVTALIEAGAALEDQDDDGYTALMYAANAGHDDVVQKLLQLGANPNATDGEKSTPLMFAAQHDHLAIVRHLLAAGADPNPRGDHGLTALGLAQQNSHQRTAAVLITAGAV
jgi:hypothetical protein